MAIDPEIGPAEKLSPEQFEEFYAATNRALRSYICRVAWNQTIADDVLQESYIRMLNALPLSHRHKPDTGPTASRRAAAALVAAVRKAGRANR